MTRQDYRYCLQIKDDVDLVYVLKKWQITEVELHHILKKNTFFVNDTVDMNILKQVYG